MVVVEDGEVKKTNPMAKDGDYFIYDGKHPAIIPNELYEVAQQKRGRTPRVNSKNKITNPLAGIIYCQCGKAMVYRPHKSNPRIHCSEQVYCHTRSCLYSEMLDFVTNLLKKRIAEFKIEIQNDDNTSIDLHEKLIDNLEKKLASIQARELSQWESQSDPDPSKRMPQHIFRVLNAKLVQEREETEKALASAYNSMPTKVDYEQKIITFQKALDALHDDSKSVMEKNRLLKECIKRITYNRTQGKRLKGEWEETPMELDVQLMF